MTTPQQAAQPDLRTAAQAVLDRWESPQWQWTHGSPTGALMADLRAALAAAPAAPVVAQEPVAFSCASRTQDGRACRSHCGNFTTCPATQAAPVQPAAPAVAELVEALRNILDAGELEAKAHRALQNARENFSDSRDESKALGRAMQAASEAESEARAALTRYQEAKP